MHKPADMEVWQGRIDTEETTPAHRWHQKIISWDQQTELNHSTTLLGFACDEGVRRNKGRPGAEEGPRAIRAAMANLAYNQTAAIYDAGDVICDNKQLEEAQKILGNHVTNILNHNGFPLLLGGGHEIAWGSFLGITHYLNQTTPQSRLGIINFDAHLDLRNPVPQPNSGTPFRQMALWCIENKQAFHYTVLGINPTANTQAVFEFARQHQVEWVEDTQCNLNRLQQLESKISDFLQQIDILYLTICLDVFPASAAPGVSAPCAIGVDPALVLSLIKTVKDLCKQNRVTLLMADIAEMNPQYDRDGITAKLAARLAYHIVA